MLAFGGQLELAQVTVVSLVPRQHRNMAYDRNTPLNRVHTHQLGEEYSRDFAAKVEAFKAGLDELDGIDYDIIGCLDADVSFGEDYFEFLLDRFEETSDLGVAGTDYVEGEFHSFRDSYISAQHVNGQVQLFRRRCFEEIGGYVPIREGGIDWVAVTTARMNGWVTRSENALNTHTGRRGKDTPYDWINLHSKVADNTYYRFMRSDCRSKNSKSIAKLLCYSFFYLLKYPP